MNSIGFDENVILVSKLLLGLEHQPLIA